MTKTKMVSVFFQGQLEGRLVLSFDEKDFIDAEKKFSEEKFNQWLYKEIRTAMPKIGGMKFEICDNGCVDMFHFPEMPTVALTVS